MNMVLIKPPQNNSRYEIAEGLFIVEAITQKFRREVMSIQFQTPDLINIYFQIDIPKNVIKLIIQRLAQEDLYISTNLTIEIYLKHVLVYRFIPQQVISSFTYGNDVF